MLTDSVRTLRFLRGWVTTRWSVDEHEIVVERQGGPVPASLFVPRGRARGLTGWVVLHGITRPGRAHPSLLRFARSLASTPAAVLVPEIPEWRELRLAPESAASTIRASILALDARPETEPGHTGVVGFSFGAPMAIAASTDPSLSGHLSAVVAFGGYCDLERTMRFQFSGRHEWQGREERLVPDPYGRWVVGANYLTGVPGHEDAEDVAAAVRELAREAGDRRIASVSPIFDPIKERLREALPRSRRDVFDLLAPPSTAPAPDDETVEVFGTALARAARAAAPGLDPGPILDRVRTPVRLVHGRYDELIPYTETLRLQAGFPPEADVHAFVTGLFAHAKGSSTGASLHFAKEGIRFFNGLRRAIGVA
jgi:pimeloyl-ACP methyl ester carboxylesterase